METKNYKGLMAERRFEIANLIMDEDVIMDINKFNDWIADMTMCGAVCRIKNDILCIESLGERQFSLSSVMMENGKKMLRLYEIKKEFVIVPC